jgi:membrane-bound serine protease (ClpP class)
MEPLGLVVTLLLCGLLALAVELFLIPGFGIPGIMGIAFLIGGSVLAWVRFGPVVGVLTILGTASASVGLTIVVFRSKRVRKRFVLSAHLKQGGGTESADLVHLIGKVGIARTDLRPSGIATIDDVRVDVVSQGGFIDKESEIEVVEVDGPRIVVTRKN